MSAKKTRVQNPSTSRVPTNWTAAQIKRLPGGKFQVKIPMGKAKSNPSGKWLVYLTDDPSQVTDAPEYIGSYHSEREANKAAAKALGLPNLRGLSQAPTENGVSYYAPGSDDYSGQSVEVRSNPRSSPSRKRNIAGFQDAQGVFHPIRAGTRLVKHGKRKSRVADKRAYSRKKAGEGRKRR